jgi:hypothetical protein
MGDTANEPRWSSLDWKDLVDGYKEYWCLPFVAGFAGVVLRSDGRLPARILRLRKRQGQEAIQGLERVLDALDEIGAVPAAPAGIRRAEVGPGGQGEGAPAVGSAGRGP